MKHYKWETEHSKILFKYNLLKYYQHGDILWKLHDKSVEVIGKISKSNRLQLMKNKYIHFSLFK